MIINRAFLHNLDDTMKTVSELNNAFISENKACRYHLIREGNIMCARFGDIKSSFSELTALMKQIQETKFEAPQDIDLRKHIFSYFQEITDGFANKKRSFFIKFFFGIEIRRQIREAQAIIDKCTPLSLQSRLSSMKDPSAKTSHIDITALTIKRLEYMNNRRCDHFYHLHVDPRTGQTLPFVISTDRHLDISAEDTAKYLRHFRDSCLLWPSVVAKCQRLHCWQDVSTDAIPRAQLFDSMDALQSGRMDISELPSVLDEGIEFLWQRFRFNRPLDSDILMTHCAKAMEKFRNNYEDLIKCATSDVDQESCRQEIKACEEKQKSMLTLLEQINCRYKDIPNGWAICKGSIYQDCYSWEYSDPDGQKYQRYKQLEHEANQHAAHPVIRKFFEDYLFYTYIVKNDPNAKYDD